MDPITFILWMYLSWGITRMFFRGEYDEPAPEGPAKPKAAPKPPPPGEEPPAERRTAWERLRDWADGRADEARRNREWGDPAWWAKVLIGSIWTPIRDVRQTKEWVDAKRSRPRAETEDGQQGPDVEHDREDAPGEERQARRFWGRRNRDQAEPDHQPEDREYEVEEVPRYGPPDPELAPPIRALEPPGAPEEAQHDPDVLPAGDTEISVARVTEDTPREGIMPTMAGMLTAGTAGGLAIPGQSGGAVAVGGGDTSHELHMQMATAIVRLIGDCPDPVQRVLGLIEASGRGVALKVDGLQGAGVTGSVLARWVDVLVAFQAAHNTAKVLQGQIDAALQMAADARRHQAAVGDPVQSAVVAAGSNAATDTKYYAAQ